MASTGCLDAEVTIGALPNEVKIRALGYAGDVDHLKQDARNGYSRLLRVPSEENISSSQRQVSTDSDGQLVRCVRMVQVLVQGRTHDGMRTIIENDLSNIHYGDLLPTKKVCIDTGDVQNAWVSVLHENLGLPNGWLQQFITLTSCGEAMVKVSNECPGLPTWCIFNQVCVYVND